MPDPVSQRRILKYFIGLGVTLHLPAGAKVVHAGVQNQEYYIWVEIEDTEVVRPTEARTFVIIGTGHPIYEGEHVATFFAEPFVWHVYEVPAE